MDHSIRSHGDITPTLGSRVYIDQRATVIGDVCLAEDVSIWPGAVIRGDMHSLRVGARSNIQDNAVLHITHPSAFNPSGWPLSVGEDVIVGHGTILHGCSIGNRVLIGNGAIVNDGAIVEEEVIVGAGCLVPPGKTLKSGFVYIGNPCTVLRRVTESERAFFLYSPAHYVKLKDQYLAELGTKNQI